VRWGSGAGLLPPATGSAGGSCPPPGWVGLEETIPGVSGLGWPQPAAPRGPLWPHTGSLAPAWDPPFGLPRSEEGGRDHPILGMPGGTGCVLLLRAPGWVSGGVFFFDLMSFIKQMEPSVEWGTKGGSARRRRNHLGGRVTWGKRRARPETPSISRRKVRRFHEPAFPKEAACPRSRGGVCVCVYIFLTRSIIDAVNKQNWAKTKKRTIQFARKHNNMKGKLDKKTNVIPQAQLCKAARLILTGIGRTDFCQRLLIPVQRGCGWAARGSWSRSPHAGLAPLCGSRNGSWQLLRGSDAPR